MRKNFKFLCCVILFCSCVAGLDLHSNVNSHNKVVVCYVKGWAAYRPGNGEFLVDFIDPMLCTHIIYGNALLDNVTHSIQSLVPYLDLEEGGGLGQYKKVVNLKEKNPELKVSLSIGGPFKEESRKFSDMADKPENRKKFIENVFAFIKKYGFDGLDMNWQYPGSGDGSRVQDKENFVILLKEMRTEFEKNGLILTASISGIPSTINRSYDILAINQHVHFIHVMADDYHRPDEYQTTGHNAPLRMSVNSSLIESYKRLSVEDTVKNLLKSGASPDKLVLGVPFYGKTFTLEDKNLHEIGSPSNGTGLKGPYTRTNHYIAYNEVYRICKELTATQSGVDKWIEQWDDVAKVPFMYKGENWISYDNEKSIAIKARYAFNQGLAGLMIWSIDKDDFLPECSNRSISITESHPFRIQRGIK
uniref:GH18 domain-containing protein n=1 Tax=Daphnia galeata TaxID=27404 RepID=A0A8J2WKM2_9CRUS|nr:unnamed protein product [Daphnia galeata]